MQAYLGNHEAVEFILDACPWGMGGLLMIGRQPRAWFATPVTQHDIRIFGHRLGDAAGQQFWECFAAYIALRIWQMHWIHRRVKLQITGDSVVMLTVMLTMKPTSSPSIGVLAREAALLISESSFAPAVEASHISGLSNKAADMLSRRFAPRDSKSWETPALLASVPETQVEDRPRSWYRTLHENWDMGCQRDLANLAPSPGLRAGAYQAGVRPRSYHASVYGRVLQV